MADTLATLPVTRIKGVGSQLQNKLAKLDLHSVEDLLFHLPFRYLDRTRITPIAALTPNLEVVIEGDIRLADIAYGRRRSLVCKIQDKTGTITLRFFHFSSAQKNHLKPGTRLRCYGEVKRGASGLEMYHPEYDFLDQNAPRLLDDCLTPVYPAVEGLTQPRLRNIIHQALLLMKQYPLQELLPITLSANKNTDSLVNTLQFIHQPPAGTNTAELVDARHPTQQRLIFEELLAHHLSLLKLRQRNQSRRAPRMRESVSENELQLPFQLTDAQQRVVHEICSDLEQPFPMMRLLQGDVGSGKTLVAALSALKVIKSGFQTALMAPTEILAEQLKTNLETWLLPLGIKIVYLTGNLKGKGRLAQLELVSSGKAQLIIGTHALFQEDVRYHNLGLVIIDEQHRFGVHQRLALTAKGQQEHLTPHQLIMTATPIPRTLAMSIYADLDCSVIDELPPGRTPINTVLINNLRREDVIARIRNACASGQQCYWVCTLIEESEALEAQAAQATADTLQMALPDLKIGLVHGRLKSGEKNTVMDDFKNGVIQMLVATTVIEVGVDVPNASLMVIENPERLGLAQLHQLRGRVGRGQAASHCVLLYQEPLSATAKQRLSIMRETTDGFRIAEKDLKIRGPGEVLGTRQTGEMNLKLADLQRDRHLLTEVQKSAQTMLEDHPQLVTQLIERWLGQKSRYAQA